MKSSWQNGSYFEFYQKTQFNVEILHLYVNIMPMKINQSTMRCNKKFAKKFFEVNLKWNTAA